MRGLRAEARLRTSVELQSNRITELSTKLAIWIFKLFAYLQYLLKLLHTVHRLLLMLVWTTGVKNGVSARPPNIILVLCDVDITPNLSAAEAETSLAERKAEKGRHGAKYKSPAAS